MYVKKSIAAVTVLGTLVAGYLTGSFIGVPNVDSLQLQGDIKKAKAYNQADTPEVQAAMEQLANDTTMQQETAVAAAILEGRLKDMNDILGEISPKMKSDNGEHPELISLHKSATNALEAYGKYTEAMKAVINGEKVDGFEQTANNALLAYTVADKRMKASAPQIVSALTEVAEKNQDQKAAELAAKLIQYNAEESVLDNSKEQQDFWLGQYEALGNRCKGLNIVGGFTGDANTLSKNILPGKMETYISNTSFTHLGSNSITLLNTGRLLSKGDSKLLGEWYGGSYEITLANSPKDFLCNTCFLIAIHPVVPAIREPR